MANRIKTVNKQIIDGFVRYADGRTIQKLSTRTGISRITLRLWSYGQEPDIGTLLKMYVFPDPDFPESKPFALALLNILKPDALEKIRAAVGEVS